MQNKTDKAVTGEGNAPRKNRWTPIYTVWRKFDEYGTPIFIVRSKGEEVPSETSGGYYSSKAALQLKNLI